MSSEKGPERRAAVLRDTGPGEKPSVEAWDKGVSREELWGEWRGRAGGCRAAAPHLS